MKGLVECVPNFSEGRDKTKVAAVVDAARGVPGVTILDVETDGDHNRCVLSFVAPAEAALEACYRVAARCRELIDLTRHQGEHPRMGAVDVIPFIPIGGTDMALCVKLAERLGERIGRELEVPVYLYDHAARVPERRDLAVVRKGQFEGMRETVGKDPSRRPDFGPDRMHATAGAVAVGARRQIINFNFNLTTHDMAAGKDIAKRVRASGGGLPCVRAKEIDLSSREQVQISTVLTDYTATSMARVHAEVAKLAAGHGAAVKTCEIVGLLPREALVGFAVEALQLENFNAKGQILEERLAATGISDGVSWREAGRVLCDALATTDATPGGGAGAAIAGGMGCALGLMALGITFKSKKLDAAKRPGLEAACAALREARAEFDRLAVDDAKAFDRFMEAAGLPKEDPARPAKMQEALLAAADVPLETARRAAESLAAVSAAAPSASPGVASDMACAVHLLRAAAQCAAENVRINLKSLKDTEKAAGLERALAGHLAAVR